MQQAQALVGPIRMLSARGAARAASTSAAAAAATAAITLPNGKSLQLAAGDIKLTMPAEWAPHAGTWMAWPKRYDVWRSKAGPARKAFTNVICAIAQFEPVTVIADPTVVSQGFPARRHAWGCMHGPRSARMRHAWRRMQPHGSACSRMQHLHAPYDRSALPCTVGRGARGAAGPCACCGDDA